MPLAIYAGSLRAGLADVIGLFWSNSLRVKDSYYDIERLAWLRLTGASYDETRQYISGYDLLNTTPKGRFGRPLLDEAAYVDHYVQIDPTAILIAPQYPDLETAVSRAMVADRGYLANAHTAWRGVPPIDLPALWQADIAKQNRLLERLENSGVRVARYNPDDGIDALAGALSFWHPIKTINLQTSENSRSHNSSLAPEWHHLDARSARLVDEQIKFCLGASGDSNVDDASPHMSDLTAKWDGGTVVTKFDGSDYPLRFGNLSGRVACAAAQKMKLDRTAGVINDALLTRRRIPLTIDMDDTRVFGVKQPNPNTPVISYCRRPEARNVVLWPLADYHSPGNPNFVSPNEIDAIRFEDKKDTLYWRGALSGHCSDVGAGEFSYPVDAMVRMISRDPSKEQWWSRLETNVRYQTVRKFLGTPGIDIRFSKSTLTDELDKHERSKGMSSAHVDLSTVWQHRYLLSLRGYDTGSNIISALNSNSVVLKEEDGWELFYTSLFKAWDHYIPLKSGATDLLEKLAWAKANQSRCLEMSSRAREICKILGNTAARRRLVEGIMDGLSSRSRTPQLAHPHRPLSSETQASKSTVAAAKPDNRSMISSDPIALFYCKMANFGDVLSLNVVSHLSGRKVIYAEPQQASMAAIGSLLVLISNSFWRKDRAVKQGPLALWGTGTMGGEGKHIVDRLHPFAVRGPITATMLELSPKIAMGDPGLFAKEILGDGPEQKDKIGLIAHHNLVGDPQIPALLSAFPNINIIDPRTDDVLSVVKQIAECRTILSSSLHGLIVADSLGIPNIWLDPTGNHQSPSLKFLDYAGSIGRTLQRPIDLKDVPGYLEPDFSDIRSYSDGIKRSKDELRDSFEKLLEFVDFPVETKQSLSEWQEKVANKPESEAPQSKPMTSFL